METLERGWDYSIQQLIDHNHRLEDIRNYTYKQFQMFVDAVALIEKDHLRAQLSILRLAKVTDANAFDKARRELFSE